MGIRPSSIAEWDGPDTGTRDHRTDDAEHHGLERRHQVAEHSDPFGAGRALCHPIRGRTHNGGSARGYQPGLGVVGRLAAAFTGQRTSDPPTVYLCIGALGANVRICREWVNAACSSGRRQGV
jgi:hypothetical protein